MASFFPNFTVKRKLWFIVLGLLGSMLALLVGVLAYVTRVEERTTENLQAIGKRVALAERWKGMTQLTVERLELGSLVADPALTTRLNDRVKSMLTSIGALQKEIVDAADTPEDKAQLERIAVARAEALKVTARLQGTPDIEARRKMVEEALMGTVARYIAAQDTFIQLQETQRQAAIAQGWQDRDRALWFAAGASALVLLLGMVLANLVVRSVTAPLARAVGVAEAIARGDLTAQVQDERKDELGQLLRSLSAMSARLRSLVSEVRSGVESVSAASGEIASGNQDLSARTENAAASIEETAASMEELTATVSQSSETARQANQLAASAATAARRGGDVVGGVVASMQQITDSSRKISDIISVIDGIAFQTNILALNAAVEAARAGEQGRGFAVVASEVRSLAGRSAEAAKEIKALIHASVQNVESGSLQVAQAGDAMGEIVSGVQRVSDLIGEITASSSEQRDGIAQINQAITQLDQMTQQNAALVEESSAAAGAMRDQARRLAEVVAVFNVGALAAAPARPVVPSPAPATLPAAGGSGNAVARAPRPALAPAAAPRPVKSGAAQLRSAPSPAATPAPAPAPRAAAAPPAAAAQASTRAASTADSDWETF
ncbi:methyl-accepting chemotaxis protein [Acidovorax sp. NCPPB 3859]|nr:MULTISPECIES: methyl-accepting chemotaxis protein [unclassified Acidovorax]MDA8452399.1 methyl-accepting chemotaxis protein [Acidovorax sp. GBBC 3297]MDA8461822.1 methyl-accepting chemotaxis protein [Acidovorax sp. GBBC 3333]MDA8466840.1 methyl-accepting chemotaxis protein [Acidovorax sp. GBBC 3332]MDA8471891.1 methyl-accepting chemotaxis protein [Acidovorax sp. GBBC 3299]WCM77602.1 methyl-accepting chemotaxis protein [Acidovorax sp. GBBC 712]